MNEKPRILVVDDDTKLCQSLQKGLIEEGYQVDTAFTGENGEALYAANRYDLIILDIVLPQKNGLEVCRSIRENGKPVKILMLTARASTASKVRGLDTGGDDYLAKPFEFEELCARVRALRRRDAPCASGRLQVGQLTMDVSFRQVWCKGKALELTHTEFEMLQYLMWHAGEAVTSETLESSSRKSHLDLNSNVCEQYISRLREKIGKDGSRMIETVRGFGYRLKAD